MTCVGIHHRALFIAAAMFAVFAAAASAKPPAPYATAPAAALDAHETTLRADEMQFQSRVEFNGIEPKSRVPAILYLPNNGRAKHPAVLLQYGSGGNKRTNYIVAMGELFVQRGFAVLTIDVPGRGERKQKKPAGPRPPLGIDMQFDERWVHTLGDYSRAIDYLTSRPDIDPQRIAYVGISWGAITGITFAAHDPRIRAVASIVGGGGFAQLMPPGLVPPDLRQTVRELDPTRHVAFISPRPLLLLNVTRDLLVPWPFANALHRAAAPDAKRIWLDTDHIFSTIDREKVTGDVIDFIDRGTTTASER